MKDHVHQRQLEDERNMLNADEVLFFEGAEHSFFFYCRDLLAVDLITHSLKSPTMNPPVPQAGS